MSLLYSVVSRGNVILARYAACTGNFHEVTQVVLARVDTGQHDKMSLRSGQHMYHYLGDESGIVFLCISDVDFDRAAAFAFLQACRAAFDRDYGPLAVSNCRARTAIPFAMNTEFSSVMAAEMQRYNKVRKCHFPSWSVCIFE